MTIVGTLGFMLRRGPLREKHVGVPLANEQIDVGNLHLDSEKCCELPIIHQPSCSR
jgi:hypothetical protein